jgi:hypothetical protein
MIGTIIRVARMVHESVHDKKRKIEQRRIETPTLNDEGTLGPFALVLPETATSLFRSELLLMPHLDGRPDGTEPAMLVFLVLGVTLLTWIKLSIPVANKQAPPGLAPVRFP